MKSAGIILIVAGCVALALSLIGASERSLWIQVPLLLLFGTTILKGIVQVREAKKVRAKEAEQQREVERGRNVVQTIDEAMIRFSGTDGNCIVLSDKYE